MSSKPLGIMGVSRIVGWKRLQVYEALYFMSDKVLAIRTATGLQMGYGAGDMVYGWHKSIEQEKRVADLSVEELLSADINNFVLTYEKIKKVELKKFGKGAFLDIYSDDKKYHWNLHRLSGSYKVEEFITFLRSVFGEKFEKVSLLKF
ncbi:MAG: hypothetical protein ACFCUE_13145 [Candidatus Bathyarchaeia archaeon]|jgi:hypothetical protein